MTPSRLTKPFQVNSVSSASDTTSTSQPPACQWVGLHSCPRLNKPPSVQLACCSVLSGRLVPQSVFLPYATPEWSANAKTSRFLKWLCLARGYCEIPVAVHPKHKSPTLRYFCVTPSYQYCEPDIISSSCFLTTEGRKQSTSDLPDNRFHCSMGSVLPSVFLAFKLCSDFLGTQISGATRNVLRWAEC